jgi:hypothetical protein
MSNKNEAALLEKACAEKLLSRWPGSRIIRTTINGNGGIEFVLELADGGVGVIDKKNQKASSKNAKSSLGWSLSRTEPELYQAILRAIRLNHPIFHATYTSSRIYDKKDKKCVTGFKLSLSRATSKLTWDDMFPDVPLPDEARWTVASQSAKKQGRYLVVVHTLKDGRAKQVNEYKIEIEKISRALYDSTIAFKTFPFNIPHSHKITENKSVTYDRGIDEWEQHVELKGLLEDSNVQSKNCSNCRTSFFDTSSQDLCYTCFTAEQPVTRARAVTLCKQAEKLASQSEWKQTADSIKQLQQDWRQLKSLSKDDSDKLWKRFRTATQTFFDRQTAYFDKLDKQKNQNRKKAVGLIKEAQRWSGSDDWRQAAEEIKDLQKRWKDVNPLPREDADKLWHNFREVCQAFFDRRTAYYDEKNRAARR